MAAGLARPTLPHQWIGWATAELCLAQRVALMRSNRRRRPWPGECVPEWVSFSVGRGTSANHPDGAEQNGAV
eukprot:11988522-Prorocentrum_lima.AAC.1